MAACAIIGGIVGAIIGFIVGLIVGFIKSEKEKQICQENSFIINQELLKFFYDILCKDHRKKIL